MKDHNLNSQLYTLKCYYSDSDGDIVAGWEEELPNENVADQLLDVLAKVSDDFEYPSQLEEEDEETVW